MALVSNSVQKKRPPARCLTGGLKRHWRTVGPDIPRQVASPQSLTPFLRAKKILSENRISLQL